MSKFTAAQLVEFYQEVADGAEMLLDGKPRLWAYAYDDGPNLLSDTERWRIKPANNIIDMAHLIKSGIDCEFTSKVDGSAGDIGQLVTIVDGLFYPTWLAPHIKCRPRMNHTHHHKGGICPVPEGFRGNIYLRNDSISSKIYIADFTHYRWDHKYQRDDAIACEILGLADGWAYPWEVSDGG